MSWLDKFFAGNPGVQAVAIGGALLPAQPTINFVSGVTAADNPGLSRTDVTVIGGGGGGGGSITILATVAQLRLLLGTTLGQFVLINGYYAAGDGGGGAFAWDTSSSSGDNAGTIIVPTGSSTGRWVRTEHEYVPLRAFGIKADGSDETSRLNAALSAASLSKIKLFFPNGQIGVSSTVSIPSGIQTDGIQPVYVSVGVTRGSWIKWLGGSSGVVVNATSVVGVTIENLGILGAQGGSASAVTGLQIKAAAGGSGATTNLRFRNIEIAEVDTGWDIGNSNFQCDAINVQKFGVRNYTSVGVLINSVNACDRSLFQDGDLPGIPGASLGGQSIGVKILACGYVRFVDIDGGSTVGAGNANHVLFDILQTSANTVHITNCEQEFGGFLSLHGFFGGSPVVLTGNTINNRGDGGGSGGVYAVKMDNVTKIVGVGNNIYGPVIQASNACEYVSLSDFENTGFFLNQTAGAIFRNVDRSAPINVLDFGALTTASDNLAAFEAAAVACLPAGEIYVPPGLYKISAGWAINVTGGCVLRTDSKGAATIQLQNASTYCVEILASNTCLEGIVVDGNFLASTATLVINGASGCRVRGCTVKRSLALPSGCLVTISGAPDTIFDDCILQQDPTDVTKFSQAIFNVADSTTRITLRDSTIKNAGYLAYLGGGGIVLDSCIVGAFSSVGVQINNVSAGGVVLRRCKGFQAEGVPLLAMQSGSTTSRELVTIEDCYWQTTTGIAPLSTLSGQHPMRIYGNVFQGDTGISVTPTSGHSDNFVDARMNVFLGLNTGASHQKYWDGSSGVTTPSTFIGLSSQLDSAA